MNKRRRLNEQWQNRKYLHLLPWASPYLSVAMLGEAAAPRRGGARDGQLGWPAAARGRADARWTRKRIGPVGGAGPARAWPSSHSPAAAPAVQGAEGAGWDWGSGVSCPSEVTLLRARGCRNKELHGHQWSSSWNLTGKERWVRDLIEPIRNQENKYTTA